MLNRKILSHFDVFLDSPGSDGKISVSVNVSNDGEEAHEASVSIKLPPLVFYDDFVVTGTSGAGITCLARQQGRSKNLYTFVSKKLVII